MLEFPDKWDYSFSGLVKIRKEGKSSIRTMNNELKEAKYIKINQSRNEKVFFQYNKDQVLYINRTSNSIVGIYKNPLEEMYPLNSEVDIFYDENVNVNLFCRFLFCDGIIKVENLVN